MMLHSELVLTLHVTVSDALHVGKTTAGDLNIIPITGGYFEGPGIKGTVCPGGADWNTTLSSNVAHVFAKYWLLTEDGEYISVENEGMIDPAKPNASIKTTPRFHCDIMGKHAHLTKGTYVGMLASNEPGSVDITVYRMA